MLNVFNLDSKTKINVIFDCCKLSYSFIEQNYDKLYEIISHIERYTIQITKHKEFNICDKEGFMTKTKMICLDNIVLKTFNEKAKPIYFIFYSIDEQFNISGVFLNEKYVMKDIIRDSKINKLLK